MNFSGLFIIENLQYFTFILPYFVKKKVFTGVNILLPFYKEQSFTFIILLNKYNYFFQLIISFLNSGLVLN